MLKDEFVYWKQAFELKELGFKEPCFGYFSGDKKELKIRPNMGRTNSVEDEDDVETAPTYSQAFRFFREKYNISSFVKRDFKDTKLKGYYYSIEGTKKDFYSKTLNTYEEAELECLKQLIKLAKDGTIQKQI